MKMKTNTKAASGFPSKKPTTHISSKLIIASVIFLVLAAAILIVFMKTSDLAKEENVIITIPNQLPDSETYSINTKTIFQTGTSAGNLMIENLYFYNGWLMKVTINEYPKFGTILYKSPVLKPGECVQTAKLLVNLEAGTYDAIATIEQIDPSTMKQQGMAREPMSITVLN